MLSLLRHCKAQRCPVRAVTIREFLDGVAAPLARECAREALAWFYKRGGHQPAWPVNLEVVPLPASAPSGAAATRRPDHPPAARDDLGGADWERDLVRAVREHHLLWRTETTYREWAARFVRSLETRSPYAAEAGDVERFLSHLAVVEGGSAATQKQALNAVVFFLEEGLHRHLGEINHHRAACRVKPPVVLSPDECRRRFVQLDGARRLMAELAYGAGLRLMELLRLRVQHLDRERGQLQVYAGKGNKHRLAVLPSSCIGRLREHLERLRVLFERDRAAASRARGSLVASGGESAALDSWDRETRGELGTFFRTRIDHGLRRLTRMITGLDPCSSA